MSAASKRLGNLRMLPTLVAGNIRMEVSDFDGEAQEYDCSIHDLAQMILDLQQHFDAEVLALGIEETAPRTTTPQVQEFRMSRFAVLPGQDGEPRLVVQYEAGATLVVRLTRGDAVRLRDMISTTIT